MTPWQAIGFALLLSAVAIVVPGFWLWWTQVRGGKSDELRIRNEYGGMGRRIGRVSRIGTQSSGRSGTRRTYQVDLEEVDGRTATRVVSVDSSLFGGGEVHRSASAFPRKVAPKERRAAYLKAASLFALAPIGLSISLILIDMPFVYGARDHLQDSLPGKKFYLIDARQTFCGRYRLDGEGGIQRRYLVENYVTYLDGITPEWLPISTGNYEQLNAHWSSCYYLRSRNNNPYSHLINRAASEITNILAR